MLIVAVFIRASNCKQPSWTLTEEWIKKMWYIYTMEYYLAVSKKIDIMKFTNKWMEVKTSCQMKYPSPRKINMVCIDLYVDIHWAEFCFCFCFVLFCFVFVNLSQANVI